MKVFKFISSNQTNSKFYGIGMRLNDMTRQTIVEMTW